MPRNRIWAHSLLLLLLLALACFSAAAQRSYTPETVPAPGSGGYLSITDPGHLLSAQTARSVETRLQNLGKTTSCALVVVVLPSIGDYEPALFAHDLFKRWRIGSDNKDNGAIFLLAIDERQAYIATGYGLEGILPDAVCSQLCREYVAPAMRQGNVDAAVEGITAALCRIISDPETLPEVAGGEYRQQVKPLDDFEFWQIVFWICSIVFLAAAVLFVSGCVKMRRKDRFTKARFWRASLPAYWACALFSGGSALVFALAALWKYRRARNARIRCETCGAKMDKLSEDEDNAMLSPSQDLEEKLDTVDYDVWVCPKCGTIERFPYRQKQTRYSECPSCHTVAEYLVCDKQIVRPTPRTEGVGEKVYECRHCGNVRRVRYRIPPSGGDGTGALLAGAALGVLGGSLRGGGGGGGFNPSGGGMSGGGGGGAGW